MRKLIMISLLVFMVVNLAANLAVFAQDNKGIASVYTDMDIEKDCLAYDLYDQGGSFSCPGYGGYGVLFAEGDLCQSVFYGYVGEWFAEGAFESFSGFNMISGKVEWRLRDGIPFATIMRWFIDGDNVSTDKEDRGQVLVISKVAQPGIGDACVIGYVDALENKNANKMARDIADMLAEGFPCRIEEPEFHGVEGVKAGFPYRTFGP